jgi:hypothetical protein
MMRVRDLREEKFFDDRYTLDAALDAPSEGE